MSSPNLDLNAYKDRIENYLENFLATKNFDSELLTAIRYSVLNAGKRIRPLLVYVSGTALGAGLQQLDAAAAAIEFIHCYSLIHDDLPAMDNDDLRRGKPTCHKAFDEATAILAGDALQSMAFELLSTAKLNPLTAQQQIVKSENKAVTIKEKMTELEQFPEIAKMNALLEYELKMANQFIKSGAFPGKTPEQAYVIIKAGEVLGLQPMQALGQLYVVNGNIGFWGAGLVAQLAKHGVKLSYENETENGVTVVAKFQDQTFTETVKATDQILTKSKAMSFAKKNKMRFHGVRMIANFYLIIRNINPKVLEALTEDELRALEGYAPKPKEINVIQPTNN